MLGGLDPAAFIVDSAVGADGSDNGVAGDFGSGRFFDYIFQGEAHVAAALGVEAGGVGVAIEGRPGREVVFVNDGIRLKPVDEFFVDGFAVRMAADHAFAGVPRRIGRCVLPGAGSVNVIIVKHSTSMVSWPEGNCKRNIYKN